MKSIEERAKDKYFPKENPTISNMMIADEKVTGYIDGANEQLEIDKQEFDKQKKELIENAWLWMITYTNVNYGFEDTFKQTMYKE